MQIKAINYENINIRATALEEFWGTEYDDDIYLWEGAKHNYTLNKIGKIKDPDIFRPLLYE